MYNQDYTFMINFIQFLCIGFVLNNNKMCILVILDIKSISFSLLHTTVIVNLILVYINNNTTSAVHSK